MKKILSLSLAAALAAGLAAPALAAPPAGWTPADGARLPDEAEVVDVPMSKTFVGTIVVDGVEADLTNVPGAPGGYLPMRAICEASGGMVDWYPEDNEAFFQVGKLDVVVNLGDLSVRLDNEPVEGVSAYLDPAGYTFLPATFLATIPNVVVNDNPELDSVRFDLTTKPELDSVRFDLTTKPELTAMQKTAQSIQEACFLNVDEIFPELLEMLEVNAEDYVELVALSPRMNVTSDVLFLAEVKDGKMAEAKEDFQAMLDYQYQIFEHYLPDQFEKVKAGRIVESRDGRHLMLIIGDDTATAIDMFGTAYPARGQ